MTSSHPPITPSASATERPSFPPSLRQMVTARDLDAMKDRLKNYPVSRSIRRASLFRALRLGWDEGAAWLIKHNTLKPLVALQALELAVVKDLPLSLQALITHKFTPEMVHWSIHHWIWPLTEKLLNRQKMLGINVWNRSGRRQNSCVSLVLESCHKEEVSSGSSLEISEPGRRLVSMPEYPRVQPPTRLLDDNRADWLKRMEALNPGKKEDWNDILLRACEMRLVTAIHYALSRGANPETRQHGESETAVFIFCSDMRGPSREIHDKDFHDVLLAMLKAGASLSTQITRYPAKGSKTHPSLEQFLKKQHPELLASVKASLQYEILEEALSSPSSPVPSVIRPRL